MLILSNWNRDLYTLGLMILTWSQHSIFELLLLQLLTVDGLQLA